MDEMPRERETAASGKNEEESTHSLFMMMMMDAGKEKKTIKFMFNVEWL
jgi:hypothetical protein